MLVFVLQICVLAHQPLPSECAAVEERGCQSRVHSLRRPTAMDLVQRATAQEGVIEALAHLTYVVDISIPLPLPYSESSGPAEARCDAVAYTSCRA